jgi:hypothetical protein
MVLLTLGTQIGFPTFLHAVIGNSGYSKVGFRIRESKAEHLGFLWRLALAAMTWGVHGTIC